MTPIKEYFSLSRNKNCSCIYLSQSYYDVPKYIRRNTKCFILFGGLDNKDVRHISDDLSKDIGRQEFERIYREATSEPFSFIASDSEGNIVNMDASPLLGGKGEGFRPMDLLLISAAGCCSIDLLNIIRKRRKHVEQYSVQVRGTRKTDTSKAFESIHFVFNITGDLEPEKIEEDVKLVFEKYCSVVLTLDPTVQSTYSININ